MFFAFAGIVTIPVGATETPLKAESLLVHPPDIANFMQIGINQSPDYSESDSLLFFIGNMSGTDQVYRLDSTGWPYQLTVFEDGVDWFELSPDGRQAVVGVSRGGSEQSQMYLMETAGGQTNQLTANPEVQYGSVAWKPDGRGFYYRSNSEKPRDFKIYCRDLLSGEDTLVFDMEGSNSISDISTDGRYMIIGHYYSNISNDLFLLDLADGRSRKITQGGEDFEYDYPYLTADNKQIYLVTNNTPDGIRRAALLDIATGKLDILEPETPWEIDLLTMSSERRYPVRVANEEGYSSVIIFDHLNRQKLPAPEFKGRIKNIEMLNNGTLIFTGDSPSRTQDIYSWDTNRARLKQLTFATYAGIDPAGFSEPILVKYPSFDGLEIPAFLYLPPNYEGGPIPFIVYAHGGPESQFRPAFIRNFQYFVENGLGILAPNIRGSSGYGKDYLNLDNYKDRLNSIKDIKAGVDFLLAKNYSAGGMVGITGGSYGGYVVLASITEYPDLFAAAVSQVGIANFVTFLQNTRDYRRHIREAEYGPLSDTAFLRAISPLHKAHLIKTPLLVIHGENDPRVPVGEARQIIKAVKDNGGKVDSLIFPDEGHGINKRENMITAYRKIAEFFLGYLKGKP